MGRARNVAKAVAGATISQSMPKGIPSCGYAIPTGKFLVGLVSVRDKQLCDTLGTFAKKDEAVHKASTYPCHTYYAVVYDDTKNPLACYLHCRKVQL